MRGALDVVVHVEPHAILRRLDIALPDGVEQRGVLIADRILRGGRV
jgi:hypothetical protein